MSVFFLTYMLGPGGQLYYYNVQTKESTYIRPLPSFQNIPPVQPSKKKERPLTKTQIPDTDWIRVKTTEGNVFYSHKVKKQSIWSVPDEIKDAVAQLELNEKKAGEGEHLMQAEEMLEVERVKAEIKDTAKRKAGETEDTHLDEVVITKKIKVEEAPEDEDEEDESEEEEEWQREAAAQLAAEAEEEKKRAEEEARQEAEAELKRAKEAQIVMPEKVDLSIEEAKALFKVDKRAFVSFLAYFVYRHYSGKKISIHCILGTHLYRNLFRTRDMSYFRLSLLAGKLLMNIVGIALGNFAVMR